MKVLFITSSRIGDAVLSSGLLHYMEQKYPDAKVTIACGPLAKSLFEGYPLLERIIPVQKKSWNRHWVKLWSQVFSEYWDMVIDLRNSAVSRIIFAKERHVFGPHISKDLHKVLQNAAVIDLEDVPAPKLWFTAAQENKAKSLIPDEGTPVIGVGPTANWVGKTWPTDRFIEVIKFLTAPKGAFENARVAVFAAPGEEDAAQDVLKTVPESRAIDVIAKTSPGEAAATLARCDFYLGNDSGLMHCAAANGVPTFGVFGPSYPHLYSPWGDHCAYARTPETFDELINYDGYSSKTCGCLMESLSVESVKDQLTQFLKMHRKAA